MTVAGTDRVLDKAPRRRTTLKVNKKAIVMALYLIFLLLPIYWLLNMSLKSNSEIVGGFSLFPPDFTLLT